MGKDGLNHKRGRAIIGFNHGLPCYVKNMALGPQSRQKPRPTASVFVYLSPSGHVFNIAWQAMIKTYNTSRRQGQPLQFRAKNPRSHVIICGKPHCYARDSKYVVVLMCTPKQKVSSTQAAELLPSRITIDQIHKSEMH